ncbi:hypothetical protein [Paraburkholderia sp. GAS32]|uniref:hypothetical protein n=1 Tax=Paraburkholderia sp. GAS32 TaxID=3035129 RepID=UPI003D246B40
MLYAPELGQKPEPRLFHSEHCYQSLYELAWKVEDDAQAREVMKKLRIRPARSEIEKREQGKHLTADRLKSDIFMCCITSEANRKLMDADVTAKRELLD